MLDRCRRTDVTLIAYVPGSRVAGPARSVRCAQGDNLMMHAVLGAVRPGEVVVLTMPEPAPVGLVGELLVTQALAHGVAGLLIDAAVRDVDELRALELRIWARFIGVRGATRTTLGDLGVPVLVGGTQIRLGRNTEEITYPSSEYQGCTGIACASRTNAPCLLP